MSNGYREIGLNKHKLWSRIIIYIVIKVCKNSVPAVSNLGGSNDTPHPDGANGANFLLWLHNFVMLSLFILGTQGLFTT